MRARNTRHATCDIGWPTLVAWCVLLSATPVVAQEANRIAAVVNDGVVTEGDVASEMQSLLDGADPESVDNTNSAEVRSAILNHLIDGELIRQEARKLGVMVNSADVNARLDELRQRAGGDDAFQKALQERGMSEEQLKSKLRDQLLIKRTIDQEVRSKIVMTAQDTAQPAAPPAAPVKPEADPAVHAYHLLVRVNDQRTPEQAQALANELYARVSKGEAFEALAKQYSEDPNAGKGGDMGWVRRGELMPELDSALFSLDTGAVSMPIKTKLGYHLVKVVERGQAPAAETKDTPPQLTPAMRAYQEKFAAQFAEWMRGLRGRAYIQIVSR